MDIAMPGLGGLEATLEIRKENPQAKILVLTQYEDREYIRRFLKAGVSGYVLKKAAGIGADGGHPRRVTAAGSCSTPRWRARRCASRRAVGDRRQAADPYETLTDREKQVLKLVAEGHSNKEVAELLDISVKTAMSHREHIMQKLDLHSRTDLIQFALQQGVIRVDRRPTTSNASEVARLTNR